MNKRIAQLRRALGLTLEDFGSAVGVSRGAVCNWENGTRGLSRQTITAVCREFNVNEQWLRTGQGEMFVVGDGDWLTNLLNRRGLDWESRCIIRSFANLESETRKEVIKFITAAVDDIHTEEERQQRERDEEIETQVEAYRQQLIRQREAEENSSVSAGGGISAANE